MNTDRVITDWIITDININTRFAPRINSSFFSPSGHFSLSHDYVPEWIKNSNDKVLWNKLFNLILK